MLKSDIVSPSIPSTLALASLSAGATAVVRVSRSIAVSTAVRVPSCIDISTSRIPATSFAPELPPPFPVVEPPVPVVEFVPVPPLVAVLGAKGVPPGT